MHNALVEAMLQSSCHIIMTMRTKTEYVIEEDEKGRKVPRKIGLAPVQRDGLEYEATIVFEVSDTHFARATKDRTRLFDGTLTKLTEADGKRLSEWLESGAPASPVSHGSQAPATEAPIIPPPSPEADELAAVLRQQWSQCVAHYGTAAEAKARLRAAVGEKPFSMYTAEDAAKLADLITSWKKE
jgi:hypothetical protein